MPNMANHVKSLQCVDSGCRSIKIQYDAKEKTMKIVTRQTVNMSSNDWNLEPALLVVSCWNLKL